MPSSRPDPSEDELKRSDDWKQKGNAAFRTKNFSEAYRCYTEALSLNPASQTIYSNRSATLLSLNKLPLALNDANRAVELDGNWAKGYRRKASVLDAMGKHKESKAVYQQSLELTHADSALSEEGRKKEVAEVERLIEAQERKFREKNAGRPGILEPIRDAESAPGMLIIKEVERRMAGGEPMGAWPSVGSCFRRLWIAEMQFCNAMNTLHQIHTRPIPGYEGGPEMIVGRLQTLEEITTAMIEDIRVARFDQTSLDKLMLCYKLEQQQRNAIGPDMTPAAAIAEYKARLTKPPNQEELVRMNPGNRIVTGWDYVRPALQCTIRSQIMNGYLLDVLDPEVTGNKCFRHAVELIDEARRVFHNVDGSLRGRSLEETFLRGVKIALGESLLKDNRRNKPETSEANSAALQEIMDNGQWLLGSFERKSLPPEEDRFSSPAGEDGWWQIYYPHYCNAKAKGHLLIAFANLNLGLEVETTNLDSPTTGRRGPVAGSSKRLAAAATHYVKAAAWMPPDDPERGNALWYAILAMVRRGAYYYRDFQALQAIAEDCPNHWKPFFPPGYLPATHAGKQAASEVEESSPQAARDTICSPLVTWPDDVPTDDAVLAEVMQPNFRKTIVEPGGGLLMLTQTLHEEWNRRVKGLGEREDAVGSKRIWAAVPKWLQGEWEFIWNRIVEEGVDRRYTLPE